MIRKVRIVYERNIVSKEKGRVYEDPLTVGGVIFERVYPRNYPVEELLREIREACIAFFHRVFWISSVARTKPPTMPGTVLPPTIFTPAQALRLQSKYIQKRLSEYPELYEYNDVFAKWTITLEGYAKRTEELGGGMSVDVSPAGTMEELYDLSYLEDIEEELAGKKFECYLYVYPNKYREKYALELRVEIEYYPPPKPILRRIAETFRERIMRGIRRIRRALGLGA